MNRREREEKRGRERGERKAERERRGGGGKERGDRRSSRREVGKQDREIEKIDKRERN